MTSTVSVVGEVVTIMEVGTQGPPGTSIPLLPISDVVYDSFGRVESFVRAGTTYTVTYSGDGSQIVITDGVNTKTINLDLLGRVISIEG